MYLVEKLWTDAMENELSRAIGYSVAGYLEDEEAASFAIPMHPANGWPLKEPRPLYRLSKLKHFTPPAPRG